MDLIKVGEMTTRHQRVSFLFLWVVSCYEKRLYFSSFFVLDISICVNSNVFESVRHTSYSQQCGEGVYSLYLDTILHRLKELVTEYQIYVQVWLIQSPRENCK